MGRIAPANPSPAPFLKWAGGKRALLPQIMEHVPTGVKKYYEPFLGAGTLFFAMPPEMPKVASDFNSELILAYEAIRDDVDGVLRELRRHSNTLEDYLEVRSWDRSPTFLRRRPAARAARFIFLNKCGFNGLYRVNSRGHYNVPYGHPKTVDFVAEANLRSVSNFLNVSNSRGEPIVHLSTGDYRETLKTARGTGTLVYLDPPYHPLSQTSSFVGYHEEGFNEQNQIELHDEVLRLTQLGVRVLLSNSDTEFIRDLYSDACFTIHEIRVRRAIAAKSGSRGVITEVLVDNFGESGASGD